MPETAKFSVGVPGAEGRKPCNFKIWNKDRVTNFIRSKELPEKVEAGLIKLLDTYPFGAYEQFVKQFDRLTQRVQNEIFLSED